MKKIFNLILWLLLFNSYLFCQPLDSSNDNLIEYWHKKLAEYLHIKEKNLKIAPQFMTLGATSISLWNTFNATANYDSTIYYNPSQNNHFSAEYSLVLMYYPTKSSIDKSCDINKAIVKYSDAEGSFAWDKTIANLNSELAKSDAFSFYSDINSSVDANGSYETFELNTSYKHLLTFYSYPYSQPNGYIIGYEPWYTPCILKKAYNNKQLKQWKNLFGSNGTFKYVTVGLIIAQEGSICIKVYDNSDSNRSLRFSSCTNSQSPFIMGVVVYPISDFVNDIQ